jgi:2-polyprenyl-3-methyl-5-hydroxy-6-metoxy-1,4-benzoquinol methylase
MESKSQKYNTIYTKMKDIEYYNKESSQYSKKRYPEVETEYVHFLFKKRLDISIKMLKTIVKSRKNLELLEIGCADGIVLSEVAKKIDTLDRLIGVDISPEMIKVARKNNKNNIIHYYTREEYNFDNRLFDISIEIGVLNFTNFSEEIGFVKTHLKKGGYYVCSLASSTSIISILKPQNKQDYRHLLTFVEYEEELAKQFLIKKSTPYGLFIPHLWKIPILARFIQPMIEFLFKKIIPNQFHEKIYLLENK